jgi:hypothetical protein
MYYERAVAAVRASREWTSFRNDSRGGIAGRTVEGSQPSIPVHLYKFVRSSHCRFFAESRTRGRARRISDNVFKRNPFVIILLPNVQLEANASHWHRDGACARKKDNSSLITLMSAAVYRNYLQMTLEVQLDLITSATRPDLVKQPKLVMDQSWFVNSFLRNGPGPLAVFLTWHSLACLCA